MPDEPRQFVFLAYNPEELNEFYNPPFRFGDLLVEIPTAPIDADPKLLPTGIFKKASFDDIVVERLEDGHIDSVWEEEVLQLTGIRAREVLRSHARLPAGGPGSTPVLAHRARASARAHRGGDSDAAPPGPWGPPPGPGFPIERRP